VGAGGGTAVKGESGTVGSLPGEGAADADEDVSLESVRQALSKIPGSLTADFDLLRRRFLTDVTKHQFSVVRMTGVHYQEAERLIRTQALDRSL
jgi:hypothetical protein